LTELEQIPTLQSQVRNFRKLCKIDLTQIPTLTEFLTGKISTPVPEYWIPGPQRSQYEVIDAKLVVDQINFDE
jgi:hypothetical protein